MNGWSNYETWNVILWLQNDESLWHEFRSTCRPFLRAGMLKDDLIYCVKMSFIRTYGASITPDGISLNATEINWREIYDASLEWFDVTEPADDVVSIYEEWENSDSFGRNIHD